MTERKRGAGMTKEELRAYEIVPVSKVIPNWDGLSTAVKAVIESSFNLEWWRGYHAPRPATMRYVHMGQPAPAGDTHIVLGAEEYERWRLRWKQDRDEQNAALRDAIRETAATADELAFWRYQAIWSRACLLVSATKRPWVETYDLEQSPEWKEAERQLEVNRVADERHARTFRASGGDGE